MSTDIHNNKEKNNSNFVDSDRHKLGIEKNLSLGQSPFKPSK